MGKSSGHVTPSPLTSKPNIPPTLTSLAQIPYASTSGTCATFLPSLKHRRLSYPRPNPTYPISSKSKSQKKTSESEWEADSQIDDISEAASNGSSLNSRNTRKNKQDLKNRMARKIPLQSDLPKNPSQKSPLNTNFNATEATETLDDRAGNMSMAELQTRVIEYSRRILHLEDQNHELNEKVDSLYDDIRYLSRVVSTFKMDQGTAQKKTRGGCLAVSVKMLHLCLSLLQH